MECNAWVYGNAWVEGNARVEGDFDILLTGPIGSRKAYTTFTNDKNGEIQVSCGCFTGAIDEFEKKVKQTHAGTKYEVQYISAIQMAKAVIEVKKT